MKKSLLLILFLFLLDICHAQQKDTWQPVDYVKAVADRVREKSLFQLRLIPHKPSKRFRGIEFINFSRNFSHQPNAVAYAYTSLNSEEDVTFNLDLAFSGSLKIWLNGEEIYKKTNKGPASLEEMERSIAMEDQVKISLKKGSNKLLIKSVADENEWKVYLRNHAPANAALEFRLSQIENVTDGVDDISNWLITGPFIQQQDIDQPFPVENEFIIGKTYQSEGKVITWTVPRIEIVSDVIDADPLWGTLYDYNYHTAGLAWSIYNLGEFTGEERFKQYLRDYCDFMFGIKPYIAFEKYELGRYHSRHAFLTGKPLLDFSTATAMPFIYRLRKEEEFTNRNQYSEFVKDIQHYIKNRQLRLPDGTLARETPEKYTLWSDDMFMGIPFLLQSALLEDDPAQQKNYFNDAASQVLTFAQRNYDPLRQLFWHAHFTARPDVKLPYWSRANGWAIWATSEVLLHLPKSHGSYKKILKLFKDHVEGLSKVQNMQSGFFPQLLEDSSSFAETSGTAIITMAIARGVNNGWLSKKYKVNAEMGWKALTSVIEANGKVSKIVVGTMTSEDPQYYLDRPLAEDDSHGLLGLIFTGIEMQKLLYSDQP